MKYYIKTNDGKKILDDKTGIMLSIHIIKKILEDNKNYCVLEFVYSNINKYSKKNNIFLYKNDKYRNLNTYIKQNNNSILEFLKKYNKIFVIENGFISLKY